MSVSGREESGGYESQGVVTLRRTSVNVKGKAWDSSRESCVVIDETEMGVSLAAEHIDRQASVVRPGHCGSCQK